MAHTVHVNVIAANCNAQTFTIHNEAMWLPCPSVSSTAADDTIFSAASARAMLSLHSFLVLLYGCDDLLLVT